MKYFYRNLIFIIVLITFLTSQLNSQNIKSYAQEITNDYHEVKYDDGSIYKGEFKNGLRNGYGTMRLKSRDGHTYIGNWENDKMHGEGTLFMEGKPNGDLSFCEKFYCKNWVNDKKNGQGFHIKHDHYGQKNKFDQPPVTYLYEGGWVNDKKHGKGNSYTTKRAGLGSRITDWWMWELEYDNGEMVYEKILEHDSWWEQLMSETQNVLSAPNAINNNGDNCTIQEGNWSMLGVKEFKCLVNNKIESSIQIERRKGKSVQYLYDTPTGQFLDEVFFDFNTAKEAGVKYLKSQCGCN